MVSLPSASQFDTAHPRVGLSTAVVLPCYNEAATIADVIAGFAEALPGAVIYVFDNNSSDNTARVAENAGRVSFSSRKNTDKMRNPSRKVRSLLSEPSGRTP